MPWAYAYEADAPLLDQPPGEALARVEHFRRLGHGQQPFGWRAVPAVAHPAPPPSRPALAAVAHAALPVAESSGADSPLALALARTSAVCHFWRSATMCRSRWAGGMWSGSPGVTGAHV